MGHKRISDKAQTTRHAHEPMSEAVSNETSFICLSSISVHLRHEHQNDDAIQATVPGTRLFHNFDA